MIETNCPGYKKNTKCTGKLKITQRSQDTGDIHDRKYGLNRGQFSELLWCEKCDRYFTRSWKWTEVEYGTV